MKPWLCIILLIIVISATDDLPEGNRSDPLIQVLSVNCRCIPGMLVVMIIHKQTLVLSGVPTKTTLVCLTTCTWVMAANENTYNN